MQKWTKNIKNQKDEGKRPWMNEKEIKNKRKLKVKWKTNYLELHKDWTEKTDGEIDAH